MARTPARAAAAAQCVFSHGDRVVFLGQGQRRGQHGDALSPRREFAGVRFDDGERILCLTAALHPIPRRPPPMF
ncbi:MAG: hypothetical protein EOP66_11400 [Sphingomonas sp.]|nr:MAG: hypothetical protein EOP66_11400 [Sphingomonas sp.]